MKEKLKKLEIKKIFQEYNLLLIDDEYKKEIVNEYRSEFLTQIENRKKELGIKPEESKVENIESSGKTTEPTKTIINVDDKTKKKIKKIYKEIVKKTHPDKVTSEDLTELYMKATSAADNYNLFELFIICIELNIEIEVDEDDKEILIKLIEMKKEELRNIEVSFIWLYANSKTEEEKNNLIDLFVQKHGKKN